MILNIVSVSDVQLQIVLHWTLLQDTELNALHSKSSLLSYFTYSVVGPYSPQTFPNSVPDDGECFYLTESRITTVLSGFQKVA